MNQTVRHLVTLCVLFMAGCGSSPTVHYYALDSIGSRVAEDAPGAPIIAVGAFRMPEYLNRSQMVRRGPGAEIIVDDFNRWAEPLDDAIHRVLASNLDQLLDRVIVVAFPTSAALNIDYRLTGRFDRFHAGPDGDVVLEVQWGIVAMNGTSHLPPRRVRYQSQAARRDDPGAIAEAMSDVLAQFCRDIASELGAIGLQPDS